MVDIVLGDFTLFAVQKKTRMSDGLYITNISAVWKIRSNLRDKSSRLESAGITES